MRTFYIGLATTYHDPAMAIVTDRGEVVFAEASERILQNKRAFVCAADVRQAVRRILSEHCQPDAAFVIAKPWSRRLHFYLELLYRLGITNHERLPRRPAAMTKFLVSKHELFGQLWMMHTGFKLSGGHIADVLRTGFNNERVTFVKFPHHLAHAANACFTSPFEEAACMIVDGYGDRGSIACFHYERGKLRKVSEVRGPESLGVLYAMSTRYCGFDFEQGEEWKVMGLAPYGKLNPQILDAFKSLITVDGLRIRYGPLRRVKEWHERMKPWARPPGASPLAAADLAFTTQFFYSEIMAELLSNFHRLGLSDNLVLGGGCALNSSFNGQITERTPFRRLHVPCAPADDGNALGAAFLAYQRDHPDWRPKGEIHSPFLGTTMSARTLENLVRFGRGLRIRHLSSAIHLETARLLADGKLVGWIQGRAEFGPRALGNRSILADPRPPGMKDKINLLVKFREEFRPFAPSILDEFGPEYFENYQVTPYMERTLRFKEAAVAKVPAIAHVDRTGRLQSVRREWNSRYHDLICAFHKITGVPMLLNTSFNIMGKPIIHSVEDAVGLFFTTGLDALVIEDYLIEKSA